jgi:DNA-binding Lrp family transcriptional regulator
VVDEIDKKIIGLIQADLPLDPHPFAILAQKIGITEDEFVERVRSMKKRGIIRRFGATLRHQEAGFSSNAMVAWLVPDDRIDEVGRVMADFREVTHCYERRPQKDWRYNLYTMIHGDNEEACHRIAQEISQKTGIDEFALLFITARSGLEKRWTLILHSLRGRKGVFCGILKAISTLIMSVLGDP